MTGRRGDAFYFGILATVLGLALWIGRGGEDEAVDATPIDFSLPGLRLEIPFDLPVPIVRFRQPEAPRLELGHDTEGVIVEVRRGLLESSRRDGDDVVVAIETLPTTPGSPQLVAAVGERVASPSR